MKAVHFGAGNIGRGFIGSLLSDSNYETVFVDVNADLIAELNDKKKYTIELAGTEDTFEVTGVSGLNSIEDESDVIEAIGNADLITTAVGPHILPVVAPLLAKGLLKREKTGNVIACENMIGGSGILKEHVLQQVKKEEEEWIEQQIGFPNAAVDRIVPDQQQDDLLTVKVEPYYEWVVEKTSIKGEVPDIKGITFVDDLTPYIERKLFTVNTGHAVAAYLGKYHGYETIKQSMDDPNIKEKIQSVLGETGTVLIKKYGFDESQHQQYINTIIQRFENPDLSDEVSRVGRGPLRKLGPEDRLVRPALEYLELFEKPPGFLVEVIAASLYYENDSDQEAVELQEMIQKDGRLEAFRKIAQLEEGHPLLKAVEAELSDMK